MNRDLLRLFINPELIKWSALRDIYEKELKVGSPKHPPTDVFNPKTEEGQKRWKDLKNRVVEHVSFNFYRFVGNPEIFYHVLRAIGSKFCGNAVSCRLSSWLRQSGNHFYVVYIEIQGRGPLGLMKFWFISEYPCDGEILHEDNDEEDV